MRLFVALEISPQAGEAIARLAAELVPQLPAARWVPPQNLHLTLAFLGERDPRTVDDLVAVLREPFAARAPLTVRVAGAGTFPPRRPARVAWLGLEEVAAPEAEGRRAGVGAAAKSPVLPALQADVARAAGVEADGRPFHAHLTLARPRRPWPRAAAERFAAGAGRRSYGPPFEVGEGVLLESRLAAGGARYRAVERFGLEAG